MGFNSVSSLKSHLLLCCKNAVEQSQEKVYQIIDRFVKEYYAEFSPEVYERTRQLYKSLVKSNIVKTNNGYTAEVYFDINKLDYYMTTIRKNGKHYTYVNNEKNAEKKALSYAAHGSHGGYVEGTAIWDEPMAILKDKKEAIAILKRMLISNGVPIK